jgi:hypothetical protein
LVTIYKEDLHVSTEDYPESSHQYTVLLVRGCMPNAQVLGLNLLGHMISRS